MDDSTSRYGAETARERMDHLVRVGAVREGTGPLPDEFLRRRRPADPQALVRRALMEERAESR